MATGTCNASSRGLGLRPREELTSTRPLGGYAEFPHDSGHIRRQPNEADDIARGTAVVAMATTGIVFGLLLSQIESEHIIPWVNFVTHYLMPIVMVLDWLFQPPKARLAPRHVWFWLIYPVTYLVYSLIRGAIGGWYPYWFIDPNKAPGGWGGVTLYVVAITVGFLVVSGLLLFVGNKLERNVTY
ncbi:MAG: Pr6Pr family membrane protein [Thermoanaerobaculia bacterium]